jgi:hypothetical protein
MEEKQLTYGEKAVGLSFNPGGSPDVEKIKKLSAQLIDIMDDLRKSQNTLHDGKGSEGQRLCSIAITELQTSQMWAVKAVTWNDK